MTLQQMRDAAAELVRTTDWSDTAARIATESYLAAYNPRVPQRYRVAESLTLTMGLIKQTDARSMAMAAEAVEKSVVSMVKEIRRPSQGAKLTQWDHRDAPLRLSATGGAIHFHALREELSDDLFDDADSELLTVTDTAMQRLVELLPSGSEGAGQQQDAMAGLLGARPTSVQAVLKLTEAIQSIGDAELSISSRPGARLITKEMAGDLTEALRQPRTHTDERRVVGFLDGGRTRRRVFYLQPGAGKEIQGSIDETQVQRTMGMIGKTVLATLEVSRAERGGILGREYFRLVRIELADQTDIFSDMEDGR